MKNSISLLLAAMVIIIGNGCSTGCKVLQATNYDPDAKIADNCSCVYDIGNDNCANTNPTQLSVQPVMQETDVWCWLAVGEMVFKYYGLPTVNPGGDYQCGIVGGLGYLQNGACDACNINCGNCVRPAGSAQMLSHMLTAYPTIACKNLKATGQTLNNSFVADYLAAVFLIAELDAKRPVISGINPSGFPLPGNSQHVALITGYYYDGNNNLILKVNDPFPYASHGVDPYGFSGAVNNGNFSYDIPYANFVSGLQWNTSWFNIGF